MDGGCKGPWKSSVPDKVLLTLSVVELNQYLKGLPKDQVSRIQTVQLWEQSHIKGNLGPDYKSVSSTPTPLKKY